MNLNTWEKEFYPKSAKQAVKDGDNALEHSIRKWEGVLPKNLKKHQLKRVEDTITDKDEHVFYLDSESCALCVKAEADKMEEGCEKCPLFQSEEMSCNEPESVWWKVVYENADAAEMVKALKRARKFVKK